MQVPPNHEFGFGVLSANTAHHAATSSCIDDIRHLFDQVELCSGVCAEFLVQGIEHRIEVLLGQIVQAN